MKEIAKETEKNKSIVKKLIKWSSNIAIIILVVLVVTSLYSSFKSRNDPSYIPSVLGYKPMSVLTGSMDPTLKPGDMVIVKATDPNILKVNDVITYRVSNSTLITHRIIEITNEDQHLYFKTKGDANNTEDQRLISSEQVVGRLAFSIPKGGYIVNWIKSPLGLILLVILPITFLLVGEIKSIFSQVDKNKEANSKDDMEV
ncbi:MAG: signal peptidase I [Firmicutes bacterium]|nr:signal peptidase I [Bacillota bacterium]